jgi:ureidoglycolate lyase
MRMIAIEPLTKTAFAPFGDVVELDGAKRIGINQGFAERVNGLARIDVGADGGSVNVSLFCARPRPSPIAIKLMERHPLGSQLFYPLQDAAWLVVVCGDPRDARGYRAFAASGRQGVNYARSVWHHPLLVTGDDHRFIVIDRGGPGDNLEEFWLDSDGVMYLAPQVEKVRNAALP